MVGAACRALPATGEYMNDESPLSDVGACVFDAYGTLLDVHSAVRRHADRIGPRHAELSAEWRRRQLEYTWLHSLMREHRDFEQLTKEALAVSLAALNLDQSLSADLMLAYRELDAFPEVGRVLSVLGKAGMQRAILSNGTPSMLEDGVRNAGISELVDQLLSAETVGIYKPDPQVYQLAVCRLGVPAKRIVFMSSNAWDAAGAAHFGFRVVWVNRYAQVPEALPGKPVRTLSSLDSLPSLLGIC